MDLFIAIRNSNISYVKEKKQIDTELVDPETYRNLLMEAIYCENLPATKYLLSFNFNLHHRDNPGGSAGTLARSSSKTSIQYLFIQENDYNYSSDKYYPTFTVEQEFIELYKAISDSNLSSVNIFLSSKPPLFCSKYGWVYEDDKWSPLHAAALNENSFILENLLKYGFNPDYQDRSGNSPLMIAAQLGNSTNIQLLITYGASIDTTDKIGLSAIDYIFLYGYNNCYYNFFDSYCKKQISP